MQKTVNELLKLSCEYLKEHNIPQAHIEVETLLSWVLGVQRTELYLRRDEVVSEERINIYTDAIKQRGRRVPLSYITGVREFFGMDFSVGKSCFIPRQETEILVEEIIKVAKKISLCCKVLDIGCGCGNISIAVAKEVKDSVIYCVDIDEKAVELTRLNAINNGVSTQLRVYQGDLFSPFKDDTRFLHSFDIIVSNPPYIPQDILPTLEPEVSVYEPEVALCGGADGLEFYRRIIPEAKFFLKDGGHLLLEVGYNQASAVLEILELYGFADKRTIKDYSGFDRVVIASSKL